MFLCRQGQLRWNEFVWCTNHHDVVLYIHQGWTIWIWTWNIHVNAAEKLIGPSLAFRTTLKVVLRAWIEVTTFLPPKRQKRRNRNHSLSSFVHRDSLLDTSADYSNVAFGQHKCRAVNAGLSVSWKCSGMPWRAALWRKLGNRRLLRTTDRSASRSSSCKGKWLQIWKTVISVRGIWGKLVQCLQGVISRFQFRNRVWRNLYKSIMLTNYYSLSLVHGSLV